MPDVLVCCRLQLWYPLVLLKALRASLAPPPGHSSDPIVALLVAGWLLLSCVYRSAAGSSPTSGRRCAAVFSDDIRGCKHSGRICICLRASAVRVTFLSARSSLWPAFLSVDSATPSLHNSSRAA